MPRNVLEDRKNEVQTLLQEIQTLIKRYGEISITPADQERFLKAVNKTVGDFHKTMTVAMINGRCPNGFKPCASCGNCIPNDARDCGRTK